MNRCEKISLPTHGAKECEHAPGKDGEEKGVQRTEPEMPLNPPNLSLGFSLPHGFRSNGNKVSDSSRKGE